MRKLIILLLIIVLVSGCNTYIRTVSSCDECYDNETCSKGEGIYPTYRCYNLGAFWGYNESMDFTQDTCYSECFEDCNNQKTKTEDE